MRQASIALVSAPLHTRSHLQVDCTPPGNILAKVVKARPTEGNYIGFAVMAVAGEGTISQVEIKGQVRFLTVIYLRLADSQHIAMMSSYPSDYSLTLDRLQGAAYQRMANLYGDVWEASNFGEPPLSLRFTDNYGVTLTAR